MKQTVAIQRIEAAFIFIASVFFYIHLGFNFWYFILVILAIDISMVGYLLDKRTGALVYNAGHSYIVPAVLLVLGVSLSNSVTVGLGLIWAAHIGMDRALGYGLKLETGFSDTHLGRIGKK